MQNMSSSLIQAIYKTIDDLQKLLKNAEELYLAD